MNKLLIVLLIINIWATFHIISEGNKPSKVLYQTLILIPFVILISYISPILVDWITTLVHKLDDEQE